jgi:hypothetical protein
MRRAERAGARVVRAAVASRRPPVHAVRLTILRVRWELVGRFHPSPDDLDAAGLTADNLAYTDLITWARAAGNVAWCYGPAALYAVTLSALRDRLAADLARSTAERAARVVPARRTDDPAPLTPPAVLFTVAPVHGPTVAASDALAA